MLSCILIFPKVPPDPLPPPIVYEYKIANFPETLDHIPKHEYPRIFMLSLQNIIKGVPDPFLIVCISRSKITQLWKREFS